ncbi:hypothetical protein ACFS7Z_14725 [Pontibacter toksunensis]|uniref:P/Homo B domain-containing protein n=1 Tax=Pontibacter toksunensis TaxID=1332631 RepID=A0ABW6BZZ9_9BACT
MVQEVNIVVKTKEKDNILQFNGKNIQLGQGPLPLPITAPSVALSVDSSVVEPAWGGLPQAIFSRLSGSPIGEWTLRFDPTELRITDMVEDIFIGIQYEIGSTT